MSDPSPSRIHNQEALSWDINNIIDSMPSTRRRTRLQTAAYLLGSRKELPDVENRGEVPVQLEKGKFTSTHWTIGILNMMDYSRVSDPFTYRGQGQIYNLCRSFLHRNGPSHGYVGLCEGYNGSSKNLREFRLAFVYCSSCGPATSPSNFPRYQQRFQSCTGGANHWTEKEESRD
jgi:hypothetical protein